MRSATLHRFGSSGRGAATSERPRPSTVGRDAPLQVVCLLTAFLVRVHAAEEPAAGDFSVGGHAGKPVADRIDLNLEEDLRGELGAARRDLSEARREAQLLRDQLEAWRLRTCGISLTSPGVSPPRPWAGRSPERLRRRSAPAFLAAVLLEAEWANWVQVFGVVFRSRSSSGAVRRSPG